MRSGVVLGGQVSAEEPKILSFDSEAKEAWRKWIHSHEQEAETVAEQCGLEAAWSKLKTYAARLMLIVHVVRHVSGETSSEQVDCDSVRKGVLLVNYFKAHALRIYRDVLNGSANVSNTKPDKSERARSWMEKKGNPGIRPRDLVASRIADTSKEAKEVLDSLVERGDGEWREPDDSKNPFFYLKSALSTQQLKTSGDAEVRVDTE